MLKTLSHRNVVQYFGTRRSGKKLYIILESVLLQSWHERERNVTLFFRFDRYCSGGSVASALKQFGVFSEAVIRIYSQELVQGLIYLHGKGIIHRDIKGSNILLVRSPGGMIPKLADFGCSVQVWDALTIMILETALVFFTM